MGPKGTELQVEPSLDGKRDASTTLHQVPQTDLELAAKITAPWLLKLVNR